MFFYIISVYFIITTNKRKKEFLRNMQNLAVDNPAEVVSFEEVNRILKKFNKNIY